MTNEETQMDDQEQWIPEHRLDLTIPILGLVFILIYALTHGSH